MRAVIRLSGPYSTRAEAKRATVRTRYVVSVLIFVHAHVYAQYCMYANISYTHYIVRIREHRLINWCVCIRTISHVCEHLVYALYCTYT